MYSVWTVKPLSQKSWFPVAKICSCPMHHSPVRPGVNSALCNYDWLLIKNPHKALIPTLNAAQHPSGYLSESLMQAEDMVWESRIIAASKQNLTVLDADRIGLLHSLGNGTNIVTPFDLEFGRMCYIISWSSFCLVPEEFDFLTWDAHRPLSCWEM